MPTYEYRCETDGTFDVSLPMGTAGPTRPCPICRGDASRVFTAPRISTAPRHLMAAIDNARRIAAPALSRDSERRQLFIATSNDK